MINFRGLNKHKLLEYIFAAIVIVSFCRHFYSLIESWYIYNHALPQELREGVGIKLAVEFANGNNPYGIEYNEKNIPVINHYGWFMSFFLSIFIRIGRVFTVARPEVICTFVTLGVIAIGCASMWGTIYKHTPNVFLASMATYITLSCYWRLGLVGGNFPDSYGLTLSLILLLIIEIDEKRHKYMYPVYVIIVLLMFYTKQYYALCGIGVLLWLLFKDRRTALRYTICGLILGIVSLVAVNVVFPLYFTESILYSGLTNTSDHNIEYAKMQFTTLYNNYIGLFIVLLCLVIVCGVNVISDYMKTKKINKHFWCTFGNYDVIMMLLGTLVLLRIGQHGGAIYSYYLQLWIPYVISVSCKGASKIVDKTGDKVEYATILVMLVLMVVPKTSGEFFNPIYVSSENLQNWETTYDFLDTCLDNGKEILLSDPLSFYAIDHDYEMYDYGSTEYVYYGLIDEVNPQIKKLFPKADWLIERVEETRVIAREKIQNGEFYCLAITDGNPCGIKRDWVDETGLYQLEYETELQTGSLSWHTYIYVLEE